MTRKLVYLISELITCFSCMEINKHELVYFQIKKEAKCISYLK